jgi:hypothetical protein
VNFRTGVFDGNSAAPTLGPFAVGAPASHSYNRYGVDFHLNPSRGLIFLNEFAFDFLKNGAPETPANGPEAGSSVRDILRSAVSTHQINLRTFIKQSFRL